MDGEGCGLLSVSDAMVRWAVVPAGLFLLIFPCSLCWLMVHEGSEAEERCGLNLVTVCPVLSSCCVLSLSFCLIHFSSLCPYSLFLHTICLHLSSLSSFARLLLEPFLSSICWYHRKKECMYKLNLGENLMNVGRQWDGWHKKMENGSFFGWPLIINFTFKPCASHRESCAEQL